MKVNKKILTKILSLKNNSSKVNQTNLKVKEAWKSFIKCLKWKRIIS